MKITKVNILALKMKLERFVYPIICKGCPQFKDKKCIWYCNYSVKWEKIWDDFMIKPSKARLMSLRDKGEGK